MNVGADVREQQFCRFERQQPHRWGRGKNSIAVSIFEKKNQNSGKRFSKVLIFSPAFSFVSASQHTLFLWKEYRLVRRCCRSLTTTRSGAVSTDILHSRARVLGVYGQRLFHGQPLTPETVSAVASKTHGPAGPASQGTVSSRWSRDCVE